MENRIELNKNVNLSEKNEQNFARELQSDIVLPDYCDDINRIIRVDAKPIIKNKYANKDVARVNGVIAVTVIYISDPYKQLRSFSFTNDFDYSFDIPGIMSNHKIIVSIEVGELNCRLLNPRKMTVRVDMGISVISSENKSVGMKEYEAPSFYNTGDSNPNEYDGIQVEKLKRDFEICNMFVGSNEAKISENITITEGPAANEIIYADINISVDEIKPLYNKAVVKFTADVKLLYNSAEDKNEYVKLTRKIPSTQIVDVDDLDEKYECAAKISLSSLKTDIDIDQYGENKIINVDFIAQIEVSAFKNNGQEIVVDAYAPKYEHSVQNEALKTQRYKGMYKEKQSVEDSIVLEDASMDGVMDAVGVVVINSTVITDSVITVNSSAELSVMVKGGDEEIQNLDCSIPIKTEINAGEKLNNATADVTGYILDIDASINDNKLTVKVNMCFECVVFENEVCNMIKAVVVDTDKPKLSHKDVQMIIYYPNKGENLWGIAKKYDSQVSKIMKYNKCENQNITDKKIIIVPKVR
ncbi:MAG: DUF3794 domain-containing protein [Oscillospiraceae bacterium]|nr:DUF3794 domain-containing protein [Oscillospiraceae bacterium]